MNHHGSESYYVLGEGLLTESGGGRDETLAAAVGGADAAVPLLADGAAGAGRQLADANRQKIAAAMAGGGGGASQIPAGFTYLGQFIDHDLTFDKTNGHARRGRVAGAAAAGPLAEPRPRLALRCRPARPGVGRVLRATAST